MKIIAKLKGYKRRLSTIKKDKDYKPVETTYGEYTVSLVSGYNVQIKDKIHSGIIFLIEYDSKDFDVQKDTSEILNLISLIHGEYICTFEESTLLNFISLNSNQCKEIADLYNNNPQYNGNKVLRNLITEFTKIDIIDREISFTQEKDVYPYEISLVKLTKDKPVYIQKFFDEYHFKMEGIYNILNIFVLADEIMFADTIYEFIKEYSKDSIFHDIIDKIFQSKPKYFEIPDFKNIFDINFIIINENRREYSYVEDVDEIID